MALSRRENRKKAKTKKEEEKILKRKVLRGKVGVSHTGWTSSDGFRNTDKIQFKTSKLKIYEDKILIERHRTFLDPTNIKEIIREKPFEVIIILNTGEEIAIRIKSQYTMNAFINIINRLRENNIETNIIDEEKIPEESNVKINRLVQLSEMYEKGLLSDEEFELMKQELLLGNNEDTSSKSENDIESSNKVCENCGVELSPDDSFCSKCGTKIK